MSVKYISAEEARTQIKDPIASRIAEHLWSSYNYDVTQPRETSADGNGQWDYCKEDAIGLAQLFRDMNIDATVFPDNS